LNNIKDFYQTWKEYYEKGILSGVASKLYTCSDFATDNMCDRCPLYVMAGDCIQTEINLFLYIKENHLHPELIL